MKINKRKCLRKSFKVENVDIYNDEFENEERRNPVKRNEPFLPIIDEKKRLWETYSLQQMLWIEVCNKREEILKHNLRQLQLNCGVGESGAKLFQESVCLMKITLLKKNKNSTNKLRLLIKNLLQLLV
jgi:hypothetical protein